MMSIGKYSRAEESCKALRFNDLQTDHMDSLSAIVRERIVSLNKNGRFKQAAVARAMGVTPSAVNGYFKGATEITVTLLDAVSEVAQIPVAELITPPGSTIKQLDADEAALLRWLRLWPKDVT